MKCFKKKLATGFIVASVVLGLSGNAFASEVQEGQCRGIWHDASTQISKCKVDDKEYLIYEKLSKIGGVAMVQVK